jgi:transcriptional regulator with XRE-family HTH domain
MLPKMITSMIAQRHRELRLKRNMTQGELAKRADLSEGTIKRFEKTGRINTDGLARVLIALGQGDAFNNFLTDTGPAVVARSLDQIEREHNARHRQRASNNPERIAS